MLDRKNPGSVNDLDNGEGFFYVGLTVVLTAFWGQRGKVATQSAIAQLALYGDVGLYAAGKRVSLRRKSLAILCYLALEGPIGRAAMASLLWEHASARQNLRVELHHLREALRRLGIVAFERPGELLVPPPGIFPDTTPGDGLLLEGLENVSASFREWLEGVRRRSSKPQSHPDLQLRSQASRLASEISPPFLLIVKGSPLSDFRSFASHLAHDMALPFVEGVEGRAAAVRYLPPPQTADQVRAVLGDDRSIWVLPTAPFGEDHSSLLELRAQWPAGRARFVSLEPLSWSAAVAGPLRELPFERAAELYLRSGGDAAHLEHLLELVRSGHARLPLPQQVRAAYQRESRFLSYDARLALERLSVHPGVLSDGLIEALGAHGHLDELERRGWLAYGDAWRFSSEPVRRVLHQALQPGRRAEYHRLAERYFTARGELIAGSYHRCAAEGEPCAPEPPQPLAPWARAVWNRASPTESRPAPRMAQFEPGEEIFFEPPELRGDGWSASGNRFCIVRNGPPYPSNELVLPGADEAVLVRLVGRGYVENVLGVGLDGERVPLRLRAGSRLIALFAQVEREVSLPDMPLLPVDHFEVWVGLPPGRDLRISSDAERAVIALEVGVYRVRGVLQEPGLVRVKP